MDHEPALDPCALASLRALDDGAGECLREILDLFLDDGYGLLLRIEEAVAARNARRLRAFAHQLSGSGAQVGAAELVAVCLDLERLGERGHTAKARDHLEALSKAFALVEAEVYGLLAEGH